MPSDDAIFAARESNVRSYCRTFPVVFERARGSLVYDQRGRPYIDFLAGCSSLNYGHNDPDMKEALLSYLHEDGLVHGLDLHSTAKATFLDAFTRHVLAPRALPYRVQFTGPTGANAVEAALKLARRRTGRRNVVAFTNGFHGVSLGALATTGSAYHRLLPHLSLGDVTRLPYDGYLDDVDTATLLERMLDDPSSGLDAPAAILLETVQGEGGLNVASPNWLRRVAKLARRHGALLIVDDIQAGCGRTGAFFSFETAGIEPDLVTLAKSLSGFGLPLAAVLIHPDHDVWRPGEHNGTFRGNNHAFVTAAVAIEKFWSTRTLMNHLGEKMATVTATLDRLAGAHPAFRRKGRGLMQGLDVGDGQLASAITKGCFERDLLLETAGPRDEVVKLLPPLTTPPSLLADGLARLEDAVTASVTAWHATAG